MWKGNCWSTDNTINRNRERNFLPKNEEISAWKTHRNKWKLVIFHRSQMPFLTRKNWSRKASVIVKIYQVSVCLTPRDLFIFRYEFSLSFPNYWGILKNYKWYVQHIINEIFLALWKPSSVKKKHTHFGDGTAVILFLFLFITISGSFYDFGKVWYSDIL